MITAPRPKNTSAQGSMPLPVSMVRAICLSCATSNSPIKQNRISRISASASTFSAPQMLRASPRGTRMARHLKRSLLDRAVMGWPQCSQMGVRLSFLHFLQ